MSKNNNANCSSGDHVEFIMLSPAHTYTPEANVNADSKSSKMNLHFLQRFAYLYYQEAESTLFLITSHLANMCVTLKLCRCQNQDSCIVTYFAQYSMAIWSYWSLICWFVCFPHPRTLCSRLLSLSCLAHVTLPNAYNLWECVCQIDDTLIPMEIFNVHAMSPDTTAKHYIQAKLNSE